jgi:hypothetical protein
VPAARTRALPGLAVRLLLAGLVLAACGPEAPAGATGAPAPAAEPGVVLQVDGIAIRAPEVERWRAGCASCTPSTRRPTAGAWR